MPFEKPLLMTKQGIGLQSPIGPSRLSLLKGNCQILEPKWWQEGSFSTLSSPVFPPVFCRADLAVATALSQELEEAADERDSIIFVAFFSIGGIFFLCAGFSEAGHGCIRCLAI